MKMHILNGGRLRMRKSVYLPGADRAETIDLPVSCVLLRHAQGNVLFDTGCHPSTVEDAASRWGTMAKAMVPIGAPHENVISGLAELGITPDDVDVVVNSHFHWDHWQGNELYRGAYPALEIIASEQTRQNMTKPDAGVGGIPHIERQIAALPAEIEKLKEEVSKTSDAAAKARVESNLRQAETYLEELKKMRPAPPTRGVPGGVTTLREGGREIQLHVVGRAHTDGDVFVYLPKEKVVVTGDAVIGWTPFMGDGYPEDWVGTLDRLAQLDFTHIVMGHGEVVGRDWLATFRGYVYDMVAAVRREVGTGATLEEVKQRVTAALAPIYEKPFSTYGEYRPWRIGVAGNVERTFAMVS